jgi:hypothetical protein
MGLVISKGLTLARTFDPEITAYIAAVETADGQALEPAVKTAYINFILGCKADGIWDAIKASCILAGARTLNGALVPLAGTAPTNFNFVDGDYNRKTGLVGDGSTKYLNSNRNNNADPQNSNHNAVYATAVNAGAYCGTSDTAATGANTISTAAHRNRNASAVLVTLSTPGLIGTTRSDAAIYSSRHAGVTLDHTVSSEVQQNSVLTIFRTGPLNGSHRLAFYSIGESLNLALLDARVTDLINAFGAAIP